MITLTKITEDAETITLGWTPVAGAAGYAFYANGHRVSHTWDPARSTVKFAKAAVYAVAALAETDRGTYPPIDTGVWVDAWQINVPPDQHEPPPASPNRYGFGWIKSARPVTGGGNPRWYDEGFIDLADYPDWFCMVESKQFTAGFTGRTTNFHLVGGDETHDGVSPLSLDRHKGTRPPDDDPGPPSALEIVCEAHARWGSYHWLVATDDEVRANASKTWTFQWGIKWRRDRTGHVNLGVLLDGIHWRTIDKPNVQTIYADQRPMLYAWLGAYESSGMKEPCLMQQTLDHRGRTPQEAMRDRPRIGSEQHSVSTNATYRDASVAKNGTLPIW